MVLILTIGLMGTASFAIGLLPTFATIGIAAPILLTCFRFLQGLSVGGEFTGSVTFLVEHAPPSQRGYTGSWAGFSPQMGALLGSGVTALVVLNVTDEALQALAEAELQLDEQCLGPHIEVKLAAVVQEAAEAAQSD